MLHETRSSGRARNLSMVGIRTLDLRKVYNSAPPFAAAAAGGFGAPAGRGEKKKGPKPEIVALDGLSLDIAAGEVFGLLGPNGAGKSTTVGILTTRVRPPGVDWRARHLARTRPGQAPDRGGGAASHPRLHAYRARDPTLPRRLLRA